MTAFFKELFEYNNHFNQKLADVFIAQAGNTTEKSIKLFNHILNAHHIWNSRIEQKQNAYSVWDMHPLEDLKQIDGNNYQQSLLILDKIDMNDIMHYKTFQGQSFSNTIKDVLFHVINHSTHHRAQIAAEFRQCGIEPLITDYVHYKR